MMPTEGAAKDDTTKVAGTTAGGPGTSKIDVEKQVAAIRAEISAIDSLMARIPMAENLASDVALAAQIERKQGIKHFEEEFLHLARERIVKRSNFIKLFSILLFFSLYSTALLLQHYNSDSYNLESSVVMSNVMSSLPQNGFGSSFFNGGAPGSVGLLSSNADFYEWFRGSIIGVMFTDSICGDGVCDAPEEVKAVGRFGCMADCGKVPADWTVSVRVDLKTVMQRRFQSAFDLGDLDPQFRYNIFSKKFNDYVFEEPMEPSGVQVRTFEALRTDSFELHLFQVNSLTQKIDEKDIQLMYHFGDGTLPPRTTAVPWGYGDVRELLAVSQYQTQKLQEYCLNRVGDLYNARIGDPACADADLPYPQGFPNYFTPLGMGLQILRSYGITGDITVPSVNEYGKKVLVSLVRPDGASPVGAAVKYCGPLPPSNATVDSLPTGMDFVRHIKRTGSDCSAAARRTLQSRLNHLRSPSEEVYNPDQEEADLENAPLRPLLSEYRDAADHGGHGGGGGGGGRSLLWSDVTANPLGLALADVGVDDRGFWKCYSGPNDVKLNAKCWEANAQWYFDTYNDSNRYGFPGSLFAAAELKYEAIPIFSSDDALSAAAARYKANGTRAPILADAALQLRFSVDGTAAHAADPTCLGGFAPPAGAMAFEYNFKTRVRLWNTNVSQVRVWLCNTSLPAAPPAMVSYLNVSDQLAARGYQPLQAGPYVTVTVPLVDELTAFGKKTMHERMCVVVWSVIDERCKSRAWTVVSPRAKPAGARREDDVTQFWQVTMSWLFVSNSRATRASYIITNDINSASFSNQFPTVDYSKPIFSQVFSPGPLPRLVRTSPNSCLSHYDCSAGLFCSTVSMTTAAQGFVGGGGPGPSGYGCDSCQYCLADNTDPVDGWCPRDKCGPDTGSYPACVDATKMFAANYRCRTTYPLYMDRVPPVPRKSLEAEQIPLSNPNSTKRKARFLTPYNQLVGSVIMTQRRRTGPCILKNDTIAAYSRLKEPQLGAVCRGRLPDSAPYGNDPAFVRSSDLFRGYLEPINFYSKSELDNSSLPFGFFPHAYDQKNRSAKDKRYVVPAEAEAFKVYFTERITSAYAQRFVTYLEDGGFLDQNTESLTVEIPTLNSNLNFFGLYTFTFYWEGGGKIQWDYSIRTFPVYQYDDDSMIGRYILEILLVVMLGINCLSELSDIFRALRAFELMGYLKDFWNVVDWAHFGLMWTGWYLWLRQVNMGRDLVMPPGFRILASPAPETAARYLATNPDGEFAFLDFVSKLRAMGENLALYNYLTSLSVLLFVLRLLKVSDFQPRIALVTRTLGNAVLDLLHFITLYCTIMLGYAIAGVTLFGHQYEGYKTLTNAIFSLIIVMIAWDPSQWTQLNHAAPDWAFDIFIWSWIFLAVFILLNILLAILVEGYMGVKAMTEEMGAPGLVGDLIDVVKHELKRLVKRLHPSFPFISDDELVAALSRKLGASSESTLDKAIRDYHAQVLSGLSPIRLPSGELMGQDKMHSILADLFPERLAPPPPPAPAAPASPYADPVEEEVKKKPAGGGGCFPIPEDENDPMLNPTLRDLIARYATLGAEPDLASQRKRRQEEFAQLAQLATRKRVAQMHLKLLCPTASLEAAGPRGGGGAELASKTLHVTVEQARNLPRMDVGAGVDVFCLIFLEGATGLHRTEVRRGKSESDWTWAPELSKGFVWDLPVGSKLLGPESTLVVLVYDKDQLTADDLIGTIKIRLGELKAGELYEWRKIVRPPGAPTKQFFFWPVPVGEVRLKVTLAERRADGRTVDDVSLSPAAAASPFATEPAPPMSAAMAAYLRPPPRPPAAATTAWDDEYLPPAVRSNLTTGRR